MFLGEGERAESGLSEKDTVNSYKQGAATLPRPN